MFYYIEISEKDLQLFNLKLMTFHIFPSQVEDRAVTSHALLRWQQLCCRLSLLRKAKVAKERHLQRVAMWTLGRGWRLKGKAPPSSTPLELVYIYMIL